MKRIKMPSFSPYSKILKWVLIPLACIAGILFLAGIVLSRYATKQVEKRLKASGITFESLDINLFSRSIKISEIQISLSDSLSNSPFCEGHLKKMAVNDVSLYDLVKNKTLNVGDVILSDGEVRLNRRSKTKSSTKKESESPLKKITVDRLIIKNINAAISRDTITQYTATIDNVTLHKIQSPDTTDISDIKSYTIKNIEANISQLFFNSGNGFYQTRVTTLYANSDEQKLSLDSIILAPQHPKYKFAELAGRQIDRVNAFIDRVVVTGLNFRSLPDSLFVASKIEILSLELLSFRDKRMPFIEKKNKPLPMAALKRLKFAIEVDTLLLKDSKITYEEFPEDGFKSGKVVFDDLNATMLNISNSDYYNKSDYASLDARAKIMGAGTINASFILPWDESKPYHAKGKISSMPLHHLNPALENLAFISVESGKLNELTFDFDYNDKASNGSLMINYENLKFKGLKKEKSGEKDDLKTLLINTIVRNDKDKNVPAEKRTGAISFERDRQRQIFNFWWKSLLSGIKGSVLNNNTKASRKSKNKTSQNL